MQLEHKTMTLVYAWN